MQQFPLRSKCFILKWSSSLSRKVNNSKKASFRKPLNLTKFTRPLPARVSKESWESLSELWRCSEKLDCKVHSDQNSYAQDKQKLANVPERDLHQQRHLTRTLPNLLSCLQATVNALNSQILWVVTHARVGFGDAAVFEHFCSCKYPRSPILL